ncbi:MAG: type II 3-dehydroquinate dehydratase [Dehalococcoidia bacterium]
MRILVINGPNLNMLGRRDPSHYGSKTLKDIDDALLERGKELGAEVVTFQSNHEGAIIDFIQEQSPKSDGIIINAGALTHYSYALMDVLADAQLPVIEVHISDIHSREEFRRKSVIEPVARKQISGHGWQGYLEALDFLANM